jgi:hypothetical protein
VHKLKVCEETISVLKDISKKLPRVQHKELENPSFRNMKSRTQKSNTWPAGFPKGETKEYER